MYVRKMAALFLTSAVLLGACNTEDSDTTGDNTEDLATDETMDDNTEVADDSEDNGSEDSDLASDERQETDSEVDETEETDDLEFEDLDEQTQSELDQDWENIDWENVRLTRSQFDAVLYDVQDNVNLQASEDDEPTITISGIDFDGETIEITLINTDQSEFADIATGMFAWVMDSFYRQLYLSSDYSNWEVQPRIIIMDENGEIISDESEFITFDE